MSLKRLVAATVLSGAIVLGPTAVMAQTYVDTQPPPAVGSTDTGKLPTEVGGTQFTNPGGGSTSAGQLPTQVGGTQFSKPAVGSTDGTTTVGGTSTTRSDAGGLARTGLAVGTLAAMGLALVGGGFLLRRRGAAPAAIPA